MADFVNAAAISLVLSLLVLSLAWFVTEGRPNLEADLQPAAGSWRLEQPGLVQFQSELRVRNPLRIPVDLVQLDYEVRFGGVLVAKETDNHTARIDPTSNETIRVTASVPSHAFWEWLASSGRTDPNLALAMDVNATFLAGHRPSVIQSSWQTTTKLALADDLARVTDSCRAARDSPCLSSQGATWGTDPSALLLRFVAVNPRDYRAAFQNVSVVFRLENVVVAEGVRLEPVAAPAHGQARFDIVIQVEPAGLVRWWDAHLANCERSGVTVSLNYDVAPATTDANATEPAPDLLPYRWQLVGNNLQTRLLCNR